MERAFRDIGKGLGLFLRQLAFIAVVVVLAVGFLAGVIWSAI